MITFSIYCFYVVYGIAFSALGVFFSGALPGLGNTTVLISVFLIVITAIMHFLLVARREHARTGKGRRANDLPNADLVEHLRRKKAMKERKQAIVNLRHDIAQGRMPIVKPQ